MRHHDLSPARFFRQQRIAAASSRAQRASPDAAGAWVHLRAWMRMERMAPRQPHPLHGPLHG